MQTLDQALSAFSPAFPLGIAFSGGADSTALLVACARRWPGQVVALHVHHGLQDAADQFESHCRTLCAELGVPLRLRRVNARGEAGDSPEDAARTARYAALAEMAIHAESADDALGPLSMVAVAQHADDQVETLLLALSRGAGLPGLSAMPAAWQRHGVQFCRPLLAVSGRSLRQWLAEQGVAFVEDPTNRSLAMTRNRIRHTVLPALDEAFPAMRDTFARSAAHCAQAQQLLDAMAEEDLAATRLAESELLSIAALQRLAHARQANLLRFWLKRCHGVMPSTAQLLELQKLLAACATRGHDIQLKVGQGFVRRSGAGIGWYNP